MKKRNDFRINNSTKAKIRESKFNETCQQKIRGGRGLHKWFKYEPPGECVSLTHEQIKELNNK